MNLKPKGLFIGLATYDIVVSSNKAIQEGVKIDAKNVWKGCGGPATNSAITFKQLGGESHLIARIGNSLFGKQIKIELNKIGITYTDLEDKKTDFEPPTSFITVNKSGEKTIISSIQKKQKAASNFDFEIVNDKDFDVICFDKHLGESQLNLLNYYNNKPRVYDPGRPNKISINLLNYANHIIAPDYDEYYKIAKKLGQEKKLMAISRGNMDILIFGKSEDKINIEKVNVVDTMGAGDILHGAYAFEIACGNTEIVSLTNASKIASNSTTHFGARINI